MSAASFIFFLLFFGLTVNSVESLIAGDEVTNLPGLSYKPNFRQFSGYLNATGTRRLHYWFVESQGNPSKDPVLLWLNGGPGCSSLDGLLTENGPFLITKGGEQLKENPFSWNKLANIIYLEAPAGVGFSYSADRNYTTDDDQTSLDNYVALKYFFSNYKEFSSNEFYITGESYAGVYIPLLSIRVAADKSFNFKGFAIGNALSDKDMNDDSVAYFAYYHGLISERDWLSAVSLCCNGGNSTVGNCHFWRNASDACFNLSQQLSDSLIGLNLYNLYDECYPTATWNSAVLHTHWLPWFTKDRVDPKKLFSSNTGMESGVPCLDYSDITKYLNSQNVKSALHIPDGLPAWEICMSNSSAGNSSYRRLYTTMRVQYESLISLGSLRMMLYNGDVDMTCNFLGEEWFVNSLPLQVKEKRAQWYYQAPDGTQQVAGSVQKFNNFTYLTVKGAGHMVPQDKPIQALEMLKNFLSGVF